MGYITWSGQGDLAGMVTEAKGSDDTSLHRADEVSVAVAGMGWTRVRMLGGTQYHGYHDMGSVEVGDHWRRTDKVALCRGYQDRRGYTAGSR